MVLFEKGIRYDKQGKGERSGQGANHHGQTSVGMTDAKDVLLRDLVVCLFE